MTTATLARLTVAAMLGTGLAMVASPSTPFAQQTPAPPAGAGAEQFND